MQQMRYEYTNLADNPEEKIPLGKTRNGGE
jgi:hypothetical protein